MQNKEVETLGGALKTYRKAAGFRRQIDLAMALGGKHRASMIAAIEAGRRNAGADTLDEIITALGLGQEDAERLHTLRAGARDKPPLEERVEALEAQMIELRGLLLADEQ